MRYTRQQRDSPTVLQQSALDLLAGIATAAWLPDGGVPVLANDEDEDALRWQMLTLPEFEELATEGKP